ncbi:MAG: FAD-binding oxidoreductase, partial [Phycisphaerae bacterium]|nr:FAD-binding oxidoreductase [Phycisphaerae bacterium]
MLVRCQQEQTVSNAAVFEELKAAISGDVRHDNLSKVLYATDASIYEIVPDGVVLPKTVADVVATLNICARHRVPVTPRGAGTGLTGGALNRGVQLDFSHYMNRVLDINVEQRTARVEPGVVLDELNAAVRPHGLHFSPDVATSNRATIGGMIGNNSAGAHSIVVGRTCDHVLAVDVVLADGSKHTWGAGANGPANEAARRCDEAVSTVLTEYASEIAERFPKTFRRNGGYALDRLKLTGGRLNTEQLIVGSEGTLCIVVGATLNLIPLPKHQGLVVVHYADLLEALKTVPAILEHKPAAVELVDKLILDGTKDNPAMQRRRWFIDGDPAATIAIEIYEDSEDALGQRLESVAKFLEDAGIGYARRIIRDPQQMADVWDVRKAGTGLLMSRPG